MSRVSGHALWSEGAPYLIDEEGGMSRAGNLYNTVSGRGRGVCSCGVASPILDSGHQRKKWHREHKARVTEAPS